MVLFAYAIDNAVDATAGTNNLCWSVATVLVQFDLARAGAATVAAPGVMISRLLYNRGMAENRMKRYGGLVPILIVSLILAYPLSLGPAIMLVGATGTHRDPFWFGVFQCIYGPLALTPMPTTLHYALQWWIELWDVYGEFH